MASNEDNNRHFWTALFEENNLTPQLRTMADETDGVYFPTLDYGQVKVKVVGESAVLGDIIMSDTFSIDAKEGNDTKSRTGFIKMFPLNSIMRELALITCDVYKREIAVYRNLFPLLLEIRGDCPIPFDVSKLYYSRSDDDESTCLMLENLKTEGFRLPKDTTQGLETIDFDHARLAVISLAHYHSLTMKALRSWVEVSSTTGELMINYPDEVKFLEEKSCFNTVSSAMIKPWLRSMVNLTAKIQRPDLTEWLKQLQGNLSEITKPETLESAGQMACILHGDYMINNMMFQYDADGHPSELRMVDFQLARIGHPMSDLLLFFYSSTVRELREKHIKDLFRLYFLTLKDDLELLDYSLQYTFEEFLVDYKQHSKMGYLMGSMVMTLLLDESIATKFKDSKDSQSSPKSDKPKVLAEYGTEDEIMNLVKN